LLTFEEGETMAQCEHLSPEEEIGFRYENPILITEAGCEAMSRFPLAIEEI
jgi:Xaa-Pro aminopeptidase